MSEPRKKVRTDGEDTLFAFGDENHGRIFGVYEAVESPSLQTAIPAIGSISVWRVGGVIDTRNESLTRIRIHLRYTK